MPRHKRNRSIKRESRAPATALANRWREPAALAIIVVITFLAYMPAMHGKMLWDDDDNITRPELQSTEGLYRIWFDPSSTAQYYPLVHTVFWLEHKLWGDSYLGYHVMNVLWHCLSVVLLCLVLKRLKIPGALLAAAIFAVHPVMVESVAWITEQKNTLSTALYLGATLAYLRFDESRSRTPYFIALGLFALALLTKTVVVTFPVAMLIIFWWQRGTLSWRRDALPLVPFFALSVASGLMTYWVERSYVRSEIESYDLTLVQRFLLAGRDIWFYISKLVWPSNLTFIYPRWSIDPAQWWQWIFPIAAIGTTIGLWSIRKRWRGPLAAWLFFCGTLFPVLGFVNVYMFTYTYVADHLQYLASLGMIALASAAVALGLGRLKLPARRMGIALCIGYVFVFAVLTARQSSMYADVVTLYNETILRNPDCWMAYNNLGIKLSTAGNQEDAIEHYRAALRLKPDYVEAYNNLGNALVRAGSVPEAIVEFQAGLAIKPDHFQTLNNLGLALIRVGRDSEAVAPLEDALKLSPDQPVTRNHLGLALIHLRRYPEAIGHIEHALQLNPNDADAHHTLGIALALSGKLSQAIEQYQEALRLKPNLLEAHASLAQAFAASNQLEKAVATARHALNVARMAGNQAHMDQIEKLLRQYESMEDSSAARPPASR
jgi:protein O-mannosyl-transferase